MTQIQQQIEEIRASQQVLPTSSTTISTVTFSLPRSVREQIECILSEKRAAISAQARSLNRDADFYNAEGR